MSVIAEDRSRSLASATVDRALVPLKLSALPVLPDGVHAAPPTVRVCPCPVASADWVPDPSSKAYAATSAVGAEFDTVTATVADVVALPAASRARAEIVCGPFGVVPEFQLIPYGVAVSSTPTLRRPGGTARR